jgi:hypothetical protein
MVLKEDAKTHQKMLHLIDDVVLEDTGQHLHFTHIHYDDDMPHTPDLAYVAKDVIITDSHHGQALGSFSTRIWFLNLSISCRHWAFFG